MTWAFHIDQMVVCIFDDWEPAARALPRYPCMGEIYTIREIYRDPTLPIIGLRFQEIAGTRLPDGWESGWAAHCFRPVRKTDISELKKLLSPTPEVTRLG